MIDDVQFISGKEYTQEEFFHTFNALIEQNKQIVISADKTPTDLDGVQERLKSRLGCGLVADIHPTTYELRLGILIEKAQKRGVEIPAKVLEFISHRIISNVREMEGALNRLVAHATLVGTAITAAFTQSFIIIFFIFFFMGLGLSFPYLFLSIFPNLMKFFPKPGRWMIYVKYLMGFLLVSFFCLSTFFIKLSSTNGPFQTALAIIMISFSFFFLL